MGGQVSKAVFGETDGAEHNRTHFYNQSTPGHNRTFRKLPRPQHDLTVLGAEERHQWQKGHVRGIMQTHGYTITVA